MNVFVKPKDPRELAHLGLARKRTFKNRHAQQAGPRNPEAAAQSRKLNYQTIMEKKNLVKQLLYEIERYKKMGNGTMCQNLMQELNRLNKTTQFSACL